MKTFLASLVLLMVGSYLSPADVQQEQATFEAIVCASTTLDWVTEEALGSIKTVEELQSFCESRNCEWFVERNRAYILAPGLRLDESLRTRTLALKDAVRNVESDPVFVPSQASIKAFVSEALGPPSMDISTESAAITFLPSVAVRLRSGTETVVINVLPSVPDSVRQRLMEKPLTDTGKQELVVSAQSNLLPSMPDAIGSIVVKAWGTRAYNPTQRLLDFQTVTNHLAQATLAAYEDCQAAERQLYEALQRHYDITSLDVYPTGLELFSANSSAAAELRNLAASALRAKGISDVDGFLNHARIEKAGRLLLVGGMYKKTLTVRGFSPF